LTIAKQTMHATLARLAECFPQTFGREKHLPPPPLKVGIAADILARCPELDRRVLSVALAYFTRRAAYLQSMVAGAARIDLDGNPAGEVSAESAAHAAARLAEILASREAGQTLVAASRAGADHATGSGNRSAAFGNGGLGAEGKARAAAAGIPSPGRGSVNAPESPARNSVRSNVRANVCWLGATLSHRSPTR
jgi:sRNA-binding protein